MNYITPDIEIKDVFHKLENSKEVSDFEISGFNLYGICRFYLEMRLRINYYETHNKNKITKTPEVPSTINHVITKPSFLGRFVSKLQSYNERFLKKLYYSQFDNLEELNERVDIVLVATSGFKNAKNYSIELQEFVTYAKANKLKIAFVLPDFDHKIKRREEYNYFFSIQHGQKVVFRDEDTATLNRFKSFVKENIHLLNEEDVNRINFQVSQAFGLSEQLTQIIKKLNPKVVVARSLYSDKWVTMSCQKAKIGILEVQHGVFTKENFYYHSMGKLDHKQLILPDFIACLGYEWLELLRAQSRFWNESNSGVLGSTFFVDSSNIERGRQNILIVFQDLNIELLDIRPEIEQFLNSFASKLSQFDFTLRIHPINNISDFDIPMDYPNIRISDPKKETTAEVLAKTNILIGATSMMLYEALSFNIPVISFERYRKMTLDENISFVTSAEDLYDCLKFKKYGIKPNLQYINKLDFSFCNQLLDMA